MMLLSVLMGTPYAIDPPVGAILCLEEVGEDAYALDRMLCQFEEAGLIDRVRAIAFGEFYHCGPMKRTVTNGPPKKSCGLCQEMGQAGCHGPAFRPRCRQRLAAPGQMAGLEARLDGVRFTLL